MAAAAAAAPPIAAQARRCVLSPAALHRARCCGPRNPALACAPGRGRQSGTRDAELPCHPAGLVGQQEWQVPVGCGVSGRRGLLPRQPVLHEDAAAGNPRPRGRRGEHCGRLLWPAAAAGWCVGRGRPCTTRSPSWFAGLHTHRRGSSHAVVICPAANGTAPACHCRTGQRQGHQQARLPAHPCQAQRPQLRAGGLRPASRRAKGH